MFVWGMLLTRCDVTRGTELPLRTNLPGWGRGTPAPARKSNLETGLGKAGSPAAGIAPSTPGDAEAGLVPLWGSTTPEVAAALPFSPNDRISLGEPAGRHVPLVTSTASASQHHLQIIA